MNTTLNETGVGFPAKGIGVRGGQNYQGTGISSKRNDPAGGGLAGN